MSEPEKDDLRDLRGERFAADASVRQMYAEKWIDISLDTDRQLLTLSTAAIGLLASFITSKGVSSVLQLILLGLSVGCFVAVIAALLYIFKLNRNFLEIQSTGRTPDESLMRFLDKSVRVLFFTGIFGAAAYAFTIATKDLETSMQKQGVVNESRQERRTEEPSRSKHLYGEPSEQRGEANGERQPGWAQKPNSDNDGSPADQPPDSTKQSDSLSEPTAKPQ